MKKSEIESGILKLVLIKYDKGEDLIDFYEIYNLFKNVEKKLVESSINAIIQKGYVQHKITHTITILPSKIDLIKKDLEVKYNMTTTKENRMIFISHSSLDKAIIKTLKDDLLINALGFHHNEIFCTSLDGSKIESGDDWRSKIRGSLIQSKIILLIITPNYKSSEICQNELGASWITDNHVIPMIIEPINYKTVGILQDVKQIEKLTQETDLDKVKDKIVKTYQIPTSQIKTDVWTSKKREFLTKVELFLKDNPFSLPISEDTMKKLSKDYSRLNKDYQKITKEKTDLEACNEKLIEKNNDLSEQLETAGQKISKKNIYSKKKTTEQEKEWDEIADEIKKLKKIINDSNAYSNEYARFLFLYNINKPEQYNKFEGRTFDSCIENNIVEEMQDSESYYLLNTSNKRNEKAI